MRVVYSETALNELKKPDKPIQKRIKDYMDEVAFFLSLHNFLNLDIQENYNNRVKSAIIALRRISYEPE